MSFKVEPGDLVRIVAPSGQGAVANLQKIISYVESLGLVAQLTDGIYDTTDPFYSNNDGFRANDLISALKDDNCKVIWCIRGGAGAIRLIKYLDIQLPVEPLTPKLLIGYSDITVLHLYLAKKYNWPTLHAPMLENIVTGFYDANPECLESLLGLLFDGSNICEPTLTRLDDGAPIPSLDGLTTGGNLTLVQCSIGTEWQVNAEGKILFLEEVGEAPYRLERILDHMKQAKVFNGAAAVVFGDLITSEQSSLVQLVLEKFANDESIQCPVFFMSGIGHGPVNYPLPLNKIGMILLADFEKPIYRLCFE